MIYKSYSLKIISLELSNLEIIQEKLKNLLEKINQVLIQLLNYNFTEFFKAIGNFIFIDGFDLLYILICHLLMESMVK